MAQESRKHPKLAIPGGKDTVGYIRLSVLNRDPYGSVENQRLMIEEWGQKHQIPIMRYYIDNGFSGKRFDRPAFQGMIQDIQKGRIDCIVVKDDCVIIERKRRKPQKMRVLWCWFCFLTQNRG